MPAVDNIDVKATYIDPHAPDHPGKGLIANRFRKLRRNIGLLMALAAVTPLVLMAAINHYQYQMVLKKEAIQPMEKLLAKTTHSFEMFLTERLSAVSFIGGAYAFEELAHQNTLSRVFRVMRKEFGGFVDIGLINENGQQVSYIGPYQLRDVNYLDQEWIQEAHVRGRYISDVFLGHRKFPHFVMAVSEAPQGAGKDWIVRATLDTEVFDHIIASMGLDANSDAFVLNHQGILQTRSKFYGDVLEKCPLEMPSRSAVPTVFSWTDPRGQKMVVGYVYFADHPFILMMMRPQIDVFQAITRLRFDLLVLFVISVVMILFAVHWVTGQMVRRLELSEQRRQALDHQMQYTSKLASIGRLAAGVAHEINNPLAIINEKTGLMKDLIDREPDFIKRDKFLAQIDSILKSVGRCRTITHRLLGFARRMDVAIEVMDLNELVREVLGFLDKEALHRNLNLRLDLDSGLPRIASDRGQLQQVFLNIITNAFEAVQDGGSVTITSWDRDLDYVAVSVKDNGQGMSEEVRKKIFEPFYTTKKGYGTGLGLSITYGIVKKLGGEITVQSRDGQGTVFTVILPKKSKPTTE